MWHRNPEPGSHYRLGMPALTRGPLPARVYWMRRLVVLGIASLLVVGIGRLLGGGSDASDPTDQATPVAAGVSSSTGTPSTYDVPAAGESRRPGGKKKPRKPVLAKPDGPCADGDILVTPAVENAVAGRAVRLALELRTLESEACTWRVARDSLTVKITSGNDDIWSSRECPRAIQMRDVVVRKAVTSRVFLTWNARRSDETCSNRTEWAMPGWYHVTAAALAGEPSDVQFELATPVAGTITRTVTPSQRPSQRPSQQPGQQPSQRESGRPVTPSERPSKSPSGAVEPD